MATLDPLHPVHSKVIEILGGHPRITVTQLYERLREFSESIISLPNLYRIVSQMIESQILVKEEGLISLNQMWVTGLLHFAKEVDQNYLKSPSAFLSLNLKEGERREFFAESLLQLDPLWNHVTLALADIEFCRDWYAYNSHPWYSLGMRDTETRLYENFIKKGISFHLLFGNDSFLDKYGLRLIQMNGFYSRVVSDSPFLKEGFVLWVIGEYLIESVFPDIINKHFSAFFQSVVSVDQFDPQLFSDIFQMKARCKITVRRLKKEAEKLRKVMKKGFF